MERMRKKLLNSTLRVYAIFAMVVLLAGAPIFYFTIQWLYVNDTNETLLLTKNSFTKTVLPRLNQKDIPSFNRMNWNMCILPLEKGIDTDIFQIRQYPDSIENEDDAYRVLLTPVVIESKPYMLMIRMNMIENENLVESIAIVFITIILIFLLGLYAITRKYSQHLWMPFYNVLKQIEAFEIDKNNTPHWPLTNIEEFVRLNDAFKVLIDKNVSIYKKQKEFVENAAHELQTPLAAFQAKLDTLMQTSNITPSQSVIIEDLVNAVSRLARLNKNLLLLSKLDRNMFPEAEEISVNALLLKQLAFFIPQAETKEIKISYQLNNEIIVNTNASLLDSLLSNLLLNSIRHNYSGGIINVTILGRELSIENTGNEEALDSSKIFERFAKSKSSQRGNGLGLAIVQKIALLYCWRLDYCKNADKHRFTLNF